MLVRIHRTYFYSLRHMGMINQSYPDNINLTFIALTTMAINHYLSACKTSEFKVLPEFVPGGGLQSRCKRRNINHALNNACGNESRRLDANFLSAFLHVRAKKIHHIRSMIRGWIHSTCTNPVIAQPHNNQGSIYEDVLDSFSQKLIELPDTTFNHLSSLVILGKIACE